MGFEFCPDCKSMMVPKEGAWICRKCGRRVEKAVKESGGESFVSVTKQMSRETPVLEGNIAIAPTMNARCPECGNGKAYWEMKQTRKADEPPTLFLTCTKCGNRWRKY